MRLIGFSTGALARNDFRRALQMLAERRVRAVELSALRQDELMPLVEQFGGDSAALRHQTERASRE